MVKLWTTAVLLTAALAYGAATLTLESDAAWSEAVATAGQ